MCFNKKRIASLFFLFMFSALTFFPASAASAASALEGPANVRAGDSITLNMRVSGDSLRALQGKITYNTNQLTYKGHNNLIKKWDMDITDNGGEITFLGVTEDMSAPIQGSVRIFSLTFTVRSSLASGTKISVATTPVSASDGNADTTLPASSYSTTLSSPLSSNNYLQSLSVKEENLSPAFSATVTKYSLQVPYTVSSLSVSAVAADSRGKVSVSGSKIAVGKNTVTVRVTAANGAVRTYTIAVTREQDPNYISGSDARLKNISLSQGMLSPAFSPEREQYVVYVPFEVTEITLSGVGLDAKAQPVKDYHATLTVGDNPITITGIAEDGAQKMYTVTVRRMEEYISKDTQTSPFPVSESSADKYKEPENSADTSSNNPRYTDTAGIFESPIALAVIGMLFFLVIAILIFVVKRKS